jgi:hypothetical protein
VFGACIVFAFMLFAFPFVFCFRLGVVGDVWMDIVTRESKGRKEYCTGFQSIHILLKHEWEPSKQNIRFWS